MIPQRPEPPPQMSTMAFRKADPSDALSLAELWGVSFPGARPVGERLRQLDSGLPYGGIETAWVEEQAGEIRGAFRLYRFTEVIARASLPMAGLASVAVDPSARRRGLARELCGEAVRLARERGDVISVLYPFKPSFYRALGWGAVGELRMHIFRPEDLPEHPRGCQVRRGRVEHRQAVAACYEAVARASNGLIVRPEGAWTHLLGDPGNHLYILAGDGGLAGYLVARHRSGRRPAANELILRELVGRDQEARRALFGWVSAQRDQWRRVRYDVPPDEGLHHLLADPRTPCFGYPRPLWHPVGRLLQGPMLRVLDVPAALAAPRTWGGRQPVSGTVVLEVQDELVPDNRGPWRLEVSGGEAAVGRGGADGAGARLMTDAATFGSIYAGELAPSLAARLGLARLEGDDALADLVFSTEERFRLLDTF